MEQAVKKVEFARLCGFSPAYVTKLNKQGRLVKNPRGLILLEASLAKIEATGEISKTRARPDEAAPPVDAEQPPEAESDTVRYKRAQAQKEEAVARLKHLEYQKQTAEVVYREDVAREIGKAIKIAREKLFAMPVNLAPRLASQTDEKVIFAILMNGAEDVIRELQQGLAAHGSEEAGI